MSAKIMDGKKIASEILDEVRAEVKALSERGIIPKLSVILVGDDPASVMYARSKERACKKSGIDYELITFPSDAKEESVLQELERLSVDQSCHGIMVELPLPEHMNKDRIMMAINPLKDVDGINPINRGQMFTKKTGLFPVTPQSCIEIMKRSGITIEGKNVCLIGRGDTVGKPLIFLLLNENATVTVCHTRTRDLSFHTKRADIVVAAAGKPDLVTEDMVSPGVVVVDAGINQVDGKTVGDVDFEGVSKKAEAITPVPGGVGSLTTALLQKNLLKAIELQQSQ
ncbi:MAG TPA: bifunctional 5,10-methylenetetrahydrofolate dehydrogenase/5,10-methenyltetrahydrofolate cyclohydrolase [Bacillota bacterium]|nr:bifunctional 5,10-methylenetetrahydrofolate dehydrogenase/5,10-methenyltetrahydrofolate cyclohydrolase [Bacillota bacterium]HOL12203.1 bifunctional 5,10-methylenetetrahydrofolate dehydrogenase/5,10-methenyltetrahydrofolate cyclohydrolase [Bacillota bacterium]HOQ02241.1 bifunctional 5,10-methylenetetrahydrofolate dehydrogenase/5,10-methenyltetrahydrofolate cyclohydrolase [Bacillota bacterium]HPP61180.1 bifunctional 5,10-methylenetetrahydrofolate dehydrogenase/5,10-methenyltetrahydrofolate cycl